MDTTWRLNSSASSAVASAARIEPAISLMRSEVSTAASFSNSVLSATCFALLTICSMELEISSTCDDSTKAVSPSCSPAEPRFKMVLDESSTDALNAWDLGQGTGDGCLLGHGLVPRGGRGVGLFGEPCKCEYC